MPRNSSGTYSLYTPGNPVVTSTVISSTWANNTLADLASALTDSLSRTGDGGMQAPLELTNGAIGAPALTWASESTAGLYRNAAGDFRFAVGGSDALGITASALTVPNGTVGAPAVAFASDTDSGLYRIGANNIGVGVNGAKVLDIATTGLAVTGTFSATTTVSGTVLTASTAFRAADGAVGTPSYSFTNDTDTGLYSSAANALGITTGGTLRATISSTALEATVPVGVPDGSLARAAVYFSSDIDTGLYRAGAGEFRAIVDGAPIVVFSSGGTILRQRGLSVVGSAAGPAYSFEADSDTGIYQVSANSLGFSEGGTGYGVGFRSIPRSTTTTTFVAGDVGRCVAVSAAIDIPASVFSAGDAISVYNDSGSAVNITISAGTLRLAGTATTGTRSLAARGMATLWFNVGGATPEVIASGSVS